MSRLTPGVKIMLLWACRIDVALAVRQTAELDAILKGQAKLGRGPSAAELQKGSHKHQINQAKSYGSNDGSDDDVFEVSGTSSQTRQNESAPKRRKTVQSGKSKALVSAKLRDDLPALKGNQKERSMKQAPFTVLRHHGSISSCYGCGRSLVESTSAPNDLILCKLDFREFKKNNMWHRQEYPSNT